MTVEDNGVGMRPETLARLFQPFYSEREGGSGIGTVIIKRVFEAHGGTVDVISSFGVGTKFTVTLPRES
jgi:two-component system nitrogen regulation sensor histidine kinase NtrY